MALDCYSEARSIGESLRQAGFSQWADRMNTAVDRGSTATEILMGLRETLDQLRQARDQPNRDLSARVDRLRRAVDQALQ